MSPAIAPPPDYSPPTASAASVLFSEPWPVWGESPHGDDGSYFPDGIDYESWTGLVQRSPREAFADRAELLDILDDD